MSKKSITFAAQIAFLATRARLFRQPHALTDDLIVIRAFGAFYGRDDAPRCPFRSNCQAEAVLHALPTANTSLVYVGDPGRKDGVQLRIEN